MSKHINALNVLHIALIAHIFFKKYSYTWHHLRLDNFFPILEKSKDHVWLKVFLEQTS